MADTTSRLFTSNDNINIALGDLGSSKYALAVAEHVYNGSLWVPRKGDANGNAQVTVMEALDNINSTPSTTLAASTGTETVDLVADAGKVGEIYHVGVYIPAIAGATGNHQLKVFTGGSNFETLLLDVTCLATQNIKILNGVPYGVYSAVIPTTDPTALIQMFKGLRVNNGATTGLQFVYYNLSNTNQTGTRRYLIRTVQRSA